jgi:hypothetical protein
VPKDRHDSKEREELASAAEPEGVVYVSQNRAARQSLRLTAAVQ